jgi:hypothetical protein
MVGRVSQEMLRAIELIKAGATRSSAARQTGVRVTSITRSRLYQELVKAGKPITTKKREK